MKKILILLSISLLIISCGQNNSKSIDKIIEEGNLQTIRAKRTEVVAEQQAVANQLNQLDEAIASLDSVKKLPLVTTIMAMQACRCTPFTKAK